MGKFWAGGLVSWKHSSILQIYQQKANQSSVQFLSMQSQTIATVSLTLKTQIHQLIHPDTDNTLNQSQMLDDTHTPYESAEQPAYSGILNFIVDYILLYVTKWCCRFLWLRVCV